MPSQASMLDQLDILIGIALVMSVTSLLVTLIVQAASSFFALRGKNLHWGVATLLRELDTTATLKPEEAGAIARGALSHPLVSGSALFGERIGQWFENGADWKLATAVRSEELVAILRKLANDPKASDALKALLKSSGGEATLDNIGAWFDATMDRVSQRFGTHMRMWTIAVSFAVALLLQMDVLSIYSRLASDSALRASFVGQAVKTSETLAADATRPLAPGESDAAKQKAIEDYHAAAAQWQTTLTTLGPLGFLPGLGGQYCALSTAKVLGLLLGGMLLSLGAPFWFNALKTLTSLRPVLAQKVDQRARATS
jgi:hypothetical protein